MLLASAASVPKAPQIIQRVRAGRRQRGVDIELEPLHNAAASAA